MNNTPKTYGETIKQISQGVIGAMIFGAYQQHNTIKILELNTVNFEFQIKCFMDKMENQYEILNTKLELMENLHNTEINRIESQNILLHTTLSDLQIQHNTEINKLLNQCKLLNTKLLLLEKFVKSRRR